MANLNVSSAMAAAVEAVLSPASLTEFTIDMQITNMNDASYNYTPQWLDKFSLVQDFAMKFADVVEMEFTMSPPDYMTLFNNTKGLQVSLRIVFVDSQTSQRVFTPPPIVRSYNAMLNNPQDLSKKYTTGSLMPTASMPKTEQHVAARIPVKLTLIETAAYTLRQQQFHGIYSKATMASVISHIVQSFSIKQLYLVPPDNTMAFGHIIIPPAHNISDIFDFLHTIHGIYMKGVDWYYTNNMLYIYPAYENNPKIKYTADIYNASAGNYAGMLSYHKLNSGSNNIGIVSTTDVHTTDLSRPAAENAGNNFSFMRASTLMDHARTTTAKGSFVNNNNSLTVGSPTDRTITAAANNPKYTKTTDNIFLEASKIAKLNAVVIDCGWKNAIPFQLFPGHNVKYHFDQNSVFTFQQGMLEKAEYHFTRKRKNAVGNIYAGDAHLSLRANSDVSNAAQTNTV